MFAFWQESYNKPRLCIEKRRHYIADKARVVKAMVFPVVTYSCNSWTIKKGECWRIDAFELWCWRRLLRVPWTARRSNQSILKEINPEYSLEELILKLKPQYFGHLLWTADSLEKSLMLGKIEGRRRRPQRMRWLDGITDAVYLNLGKLWEMADHQWGLMCCSPWGCKESDMTGWLNSNSKWEVKLLTVQNTKEKIIQEMENL